MRHEAQGQGSGRALMKATLDLASARRLPSVTLSTFRDIPWNAPFYASMGFKALAVNDLNPRLTLIRQREALLGLPVARRVTMRADLSKFEGDGKLEAQ